MLSMYKAKYIINIVKTKTKIEIIIDFFKSIFSELSIEFNFPSNTYFIIKNIIQFPNRQQIPPTKKLFTIGFSKNLKTNIFPENKEFKIFCLKINSKNINIKAGKIHFLKFFTFIKISSFAIFF